MRKLNCLRISRIYKTTQMKKLIYFSFLLLTFVSCEQETIESSTHEELVGVWQLHQTAGEDPPTYSNYVLELMPNFTGQLKRLVSIDSINYAEWKTYAQLNWSIEDSITSINGIDLDGNPVLLKGRINCLTTDELGFTAFSSVIQNDTLQLESCSFLRNKTDLSNIIGKWRSVEHDGDANNSFRWEFLENGSYHYEAYIDGVWYKAETTSYWYAYNDLFVCNFTKTSNKTCNLWYYSTYSNATGEYLHWHVYDPSIPLQDNSYLLKREE